jgi:hypothetical protein
MLYTVYDLVTRETGAYGTTSTANFKLKAGEGEGVIEGNWPNCLVDENGVPHPKPEDVPAISSGQVNTERDRRLALGFDYDFGDKRGVHHIGMTSRDLAGWDEVTKFAQALLNTGDEAGTITILTDTGPAEVTAAEWQQVMLAAAAMRQPIWAASFVLAAIEPIPADYRDDKH